MEPINLTKEWSDPIEVPAGSVLQNSGYGMVLVRSAAANGNAAALRLSGNDAFRVEQDRSIRARGRSANAQLSVIVGI